MTVNSPIYKNSLKELKKIGSNKNKKESLWVQKYLGSNKTYNCTKTGDIQKLARKIIKENNPDIKELENLLDSLYKNAKTFEEIDLAARLLGVSPKLRQQISPNKLDYWLNFTHGWAETDVLCQSNFTSDELLSNWNTWKKLLIKFSKDKNVHKRRASLVLLTKSVGMSDDKRLSDLAFKNTDLLKEEKDILITKAISWILRSLIKNHKKEVANYLKKNKDRLPKIAVREVTNKLLTGTKNKKVKK
ncbi:MAG: DNA alkylation repair protein [Patescibacteria group bacterium]